MPGWVVAFHTEGSMTAWCCEALRSQLPARIGLNRISGMGVFRASARRSGMAGCRTTGEE